MSKFCILTDTMRPSDGMKAGLLLSLSLVCRVLKLISSWHFSWTWRQEGKSAHSVSQQIQHRKQTASQYQSTEYNVGTQIFDLLTVNFGEKLCSDFKPWVVCGRSGSPWSPPALPAYHWRSSLGFGSAAMGWCAGSIPATDVREEKINKQHKMIRNTARIKSEEVLTVHVHMMKSFACFELTSLASFS